jgi:hypothetical protein
MNDAEDMEKERKESFKIVTVSTLKIRITYKYSARTAR